ncbi:hypothetical protein TKK_0004093 [Trichogramma kaykai]|uniref:WD repeat-containing protein 55 homolog n=1 Tax=Trichogramma kaykai TaxID=54128 RepID=A0ABD2XLF5_9HYME
MTSITDRCSSELILTSDCSGKNCSANLWDPVTGSLRHQYRAADKSHTGALGQATLQPLRDSYVIGADVQKSLLYAWPVNSQVMVPNARFVTPGRVTALAASPDGAVIVAAIGDTVCVWTTCNGELVRSFTKHYQPVTRLVFNADGTCFASGGEDGLIFVWLLSRVANEAEFEPLSEFNYHSKTVTDLYFGKLNASNRLYSVSLDQSCRVYDIWKNQMLLGLVFDEQLTTVTCDLMENNLFVGDIKGVVEKFNLREPPRSIEYHVSLGEKFVYKGHEASITALSASNDCITLLTGSKDCMVHMWDIASCQILLTLKHQAPVVSAFFTQDCRNFNDPKFKPRFNICPLKKTATTEGPVEIEGDLDYTDGSEFLTLSSSIDDNVNTSSIQAKINKIEIENLKRKLENCKAELEKEKAKSKEVGKTNKNILKNAVNVLFDNDAPKAKKAKKTQNNK